VFTLFRDEKIFPYQTYECLIYLPYISFTLLQPADYGQYHNYFT